MPLSWYGALIRVSKQEIGTLLALLKGMRTSVIKHYHWLLFFILASAQMACDTICNKTVNDVSSIQNTTGRSLQISACKGFEKTKATVNLDENTNKQEVSLGSRNTTAVRGGLNPNCSSVPQNEKVQMNLELAPSSFQQVKLCYNESDKSYLVIETYQSCPSPYLEQLFAEPCS